MSHLKYYSFWKSTLPKMPPVMWVLRSTIREKWVRFYTLPEGKQFPTKPNETEIIIYRYNAVANTIFEHDEMVWLVLAVPIETDRSVYEDNFISLHNFVHIGQEELTDTGGDVEVVELYYKFIKSKKNKLDNIYTAVMNEDIPQVLFISNTGDMFAPYAGGIDIIINDERRLDAIRSSFRDWLSDRDDGL